VATIGRMCAPSAAEPKVKTQKNVRHSLDRSVYVDVLCFLGPALFFGVTNVFPIYFTAILRMLSTHLFLTFHYLFVDKDNYNVKLSERQLLREKKDYLVGPLLHMWAQLVLQILFPGMFFTGLDTIVICAKNTFLAHVLVVEPLYYIAHRWLHIPANMKSMHGFHHMSINTVPSTSLVQDFKEHFIYIATFGPAMLGPYFIMGMNHWLIIAAYLVLFDVINAWGHTNVRITHWLFEATWSPLKYLFYTPEFHLGHHALYNANYALFMPFWDHIFSTHREYKKPNNVLKPANQQDFVFIGHNGGLGHIFTIPEISVYNIYDAYIRTWLPIHVELLLVKAFFGLSSLFLNSYSLSRYLVNNEFIGRVVIVIRSPLDYFSGPSYYAGINKDIIDLIIREHKRCSTRYFGLGNLNKMRQLNDGGSLISSMVAQNEYLKDKKIRIWTGDTLTSASIYHQIIDIPSITRIFYIGGTGKIGVAVTQLLVQKNIQVCIFSKHEVFKHPLVSYTSDLNRMKDFEHVVIGKMINPNTYDRILRTPNETSNDIKTRYLLDYTVPFMPLAATQQDINIQHVQIGLLSVSTDSNFLRGHYDMCFGIHENHIYPCHAGCILNMITGRKTDETGDIPIEDIAPLWKTALDHGLNNRKISVS